MKKKILLFLILSVLFAILVVLVFNNKMIEFDDFVINKVRNMNGEAVFRFVTNFGGAIGLFVAVILTYVFSRNIKYSVLTCVNLVGIAALNFGIKHIFVRPRPVFNPLIEEAGYSFPSGHSAVSLAVYGYILYLILKRCENKKMKILSCIVLPIVIFLVGISRVYLGVHYPTDVIGGFLLGGIFTLIFIELFDLEKIVISEKTIN